MNLSEMNTGNINEVLNFYIDYYNTQEDCCRLSSLKCPKSYSCCKASLTAPYLSKTETVPARQPNL